MIFANINLLEMLKTKMSYDGERQKVLAQNIASMNVPDYKAQDLAPLDFSNMLKNSAQKVSMSATAPNHISAAKVYTQKFLSLNQRNSFEISPTGNNVVEEEQMMKVSQNATDYQMITNLYKKATNMLKEALGVSPSA